MSKLVPTKTFNLSNEFTYKNYNFYSSSPCIIRKPNIKDSFLMLNRCNYKFSKMINQLLILDNSFNILNNKIINYDFIENQNCDGFEDMRLFVFNDLIYYIGVFRKGNEYAMVSDIFNENDEFKNNKINITFSTNYKFEKNWVFFNYKSKLSVIYRWFPLYICEIDYNIKKLILFEEKKMPDSFKNIFGSSCGIYYDNYFWFIVHTHHRRNYSHMFVVFDENMNLMKHSNLFKFETNREFSYGLLIENDEFIITYSTDNSKSKIAIFSYEYIKNNIKWTIL